MIPIELSKRVIISGGDLAASGAKTRLKSCETTCRLRFAVRLISNDFCAALFSILIHSVLFFPR